MSWVEKERQTAEIQQERQQALLDMGLVVDERMKDHPQLVNLNEDATMSGCLVYFLREGTTSVGKGSKGMEDPLKLQLQGLGIAEAHCNIEYAVVGGVGAVSMIPLPNGKTFVNGAELTRPTKLAHGNRVIFGTGNFFRYADPAEAARITAARPTTAPAELGAGTPTNMDCPPKRRP